MRPEDLVLNVNVRSVFVPDLLELQKWRTKNFLGDYVSLRHEFITSMVAHENQDH